MPYRYKPPRHATPTSGTTGSRTAMRWSPARTFGAGDPATRSSAGSRRDRVPACRSRRVTMRRRATEPVDQEDDETERQRLAAHSTCLFRPTTLAAAVHPLDRRRRTIAAALRRQRSPRKKDGGGLEQPARRGPARRPRGGQTARRRRDNGISRYQLPPSAETAIHSTLQGQIKS